MAADRWSLEAAQEILPDVRARTEKAVQAVADLVAEGDRHPEGSPEREQAEQAVREVLSRWARAMEALGLEVKGPWLVDFDNGSGYYCWRWPEERLEWFHGYEEGFGGRTRIQ